MINNSKVESKLGLRFHFGGAPNPPAAPPRIPDPSGAAKNMKDKIPNRGAFGLAQTILTQPTNLMQQEAGQKKTLLGQ